MGACCSPFWQLWLLCWRFIAIYWIVEWPLTSNSLCDMWIGAAAVTGIVAKVVVLGAILKKRAKLMEVLICVCGRVIHRRNFCLLLLHSSFSFNHSPFNSHVLLLRLIFSQPTLSYCLPVSYTPLCLNVLLCFESLLVLRCTSALFTRFTVVCLVCAVIYVCHQKRILQPTNCR